MANLPLALWPYIIKLVVHVKNMLPSSALNGRIPLEVLTGKSVSYNHLRIPGTECYPLLKGDLKKFDAKSTRHLFVGYGPDSTTYYLYNPSSRKVTLHRDIVWNEDGFLRAYYLPYLNHFEQSQEPKTNDLPQLFPSKVTHPSKTSVNPQLDTDDTIQDEVPLPKPPPLASNIAPHDNIAGNAPLNVDDNDDSDDEVFQQPLENPFVDNPVHHNALQEPVPAPPPPIPAPNRAAGSARLHGIPPVVPPVESWVLRNAARAQARANAHAQPVPNPSNQGEINHIGFDF
jgi:hypothetical protein